jgi:serine/threonine protein kinase
MTADVFCTLLTRSKLHPADAVKQQFQRWQAESKGKSAATDFAAWLVNQKLLTEYQAHQILNKKPDHLVLGEYKLVERLGKERMAGVYKAVHTSGQVVSLKILPPSKAKQPDILARFQREAKLAVQLNHPNVIRTFHIAETSGIHYLVMECLDGDSLDELLKERRKLPAKEAVRIAFLAALGLQHIHEKGLVHRDLKPGNLMLVPAPAKGENTLRSMVKIVDIGLGRALFETAEADAGQITVEGELVGTPDYLAPEQARDPRRADVRSDIYSLGCTLYHALAGQPPFPDNNTVRQALRHATEQAKPLKDLSPETPEGLQQIVSAMMAKEPAQRYQTPKLVSDALKAFLAADSEPAKPKPVAAEMKDYQAWLDKSMNAAGAAATAEPAGVVALAEPPADSRGRKKGREDVPVARSVLIEIDVEPVLPEELRAAAPFGLKIPRDLFMILVGALSVLGIVTIVWLITLLFSGGAE